MATFVLVHGSWHDEHAWKPVISYLESQGHKAFATTIAGHGKGVNKQVNHAQCTQSVVDYLDYRALFDSLASASSRRLRSCIIFWVLSEGWLQKSESEICCSILASCAFFPEGSKIAPHSVGLLAERSVLSFQFFAYHHKILF